MTDATMTGGCFCGQIRYELTHPPIAMGFCHCHSCQKISGCGYYAWVLVPKDGIKITGDIKEYGSTGGSGNTVYRGFCSNCGSRLSTRGEWLGDRMTLAVGSLDNPALFKPQMHLWTEEAQVWDLMDPDVPNFERGRGK